MLRKKESGLGLAYGSVKPLHAAPSTHASAGQTAMQVQLVCKACMYRITHSSTYAAHIAQSHKRRVGLCSSLSVNLLHCMLYCMQVYQAGRV